MCDYNIKQETYSVVQKQVNRLVKVFSSQWWNTCKREVKLGIKSNYWYKRKKERETDKFINTIIEEIKRFPKTEEDRELWKHKFDNVLEAYIAQSDIITLKDKELLLKNGILENTKLFIERAKKFSTKISIEDIGQAMRNVWIMNIIQMLLGRRVQLTPAIFGYSMLYPYTDNYLDNPNISRNEKVEVGDRFEKRLKGEKIIPINSYEEETFRLVEFIEGEHNRREFHEVYDSLLLIHRAQKKSLKQQARETCPYEEDILGISIEKGGTSVLADAYLINGRLSEDEAKFFFGYGVLLQICDDLQDAEMDLKNNHMTIVSQLLGKWSLDSITNGLINFTNNLLESEKCFSCNNPEELLELIRKNCMLLIYFAVAKSSKFYSYKYISNIKMYFPYSIRYMTGLSKRFKKRYGKLKESYNGVKVEDIIFYALS